MKKYLLLAVILIVFALMVTYLIIKTSTPQRIPLMDGLYFGMTPKQAGHILGESNEIEYNAGDSGKNAYTYKTIVLGHEAIVICYFLNNRQLTQVDFSWDTNTAELYDRAYMCISNYYRSNKGYFAKEPEYLSTETMRTSLGIDNGLTGVFYNLYSTGSSLLITCVDNS